ncbi:hypothetical protein CASFOL_003082 [Castilleja foliolosa]|uniref:Receptor-like serine/threonine-protein kinase n=1 Tax=Castilleja foliolosa TaxID=1961234 RepID=A0ABD3EGT8_9LAMI
MAIILFFLLLSAATSVAAQQRNSNITLGSSLTPTTNSSWRSPSGLYSFGFIPQNNASVIGISIAGTVVWISNVDSPTVPDDAVLQLTQGGRLILQQRQGQTIDVVSTTETIAFASMLDNGNFVLYNSNSIAIWQSFDNPTNTLLPGQRLLPGQELISSASETEHSRGIFRLKMQSDGNLVQYPVGTQDSAPYAYYASNTATNGADSNVSLNLENDGRLYLLNGSSFLKNITTGGLPTQRTIHLMRLDVDGIFRIYSHSLNNSQDTWTVRWSSTDDTCAPKGLCGLNAFCVQMDTNASCRCLPGFDFVHPGSWSAGCARNFAEGCGNNGDKVQSEMRTIVNTIWGNNSYSVLNTITDEICSQACLEDCNCEAAFYKDGQCSKQRLPLIYGRRQMSESNIALIKVSTSNELNTNEVQGKEIKKEVRLDILIISISLGVLAILIMAISGIYVRRKHGAYKKISEYRGEANLTEDVALREFTYSDIVQATNEFKEELGKGASGTVYKGILHSSQKVVAVKKLEKEVADGEREFQTEMKTIGRTYHRNLVRLLGYCLNGPHKLLVFEYMSNGSLADLIFKSDERPSWEERTKLALDIARGILYLHEECETQIIHCDIKPQNILMDENGRAKISDFGLAKLLKQDQTKTYTGIRGTRGYVAPEWHRNQPVTVKADVYSYGIVLLEIICCRRSVDSSLSEDEAILEEWVYSCYEAGEIGKLVSDEEVDKRKLGRMVKIGIWCIQDEPSFRPSMKKVLLMLEGTVEIPVPPSPTSFFSSV